AERFAKIALNGVCNEAKVLNGNRLVQSVLAAELIHHRLRRLRRKHHGRRIAGEPHQDERHDGDPQQDWKHMEQASQDVGCHAGAAPPSSYFVLVLNGVRFRDLPRKEMYRRLAGYGVIHSPSLEGTTPKAQWPGLIG